MSSFLKLFLIFPIFLQNSSVSVYRMLLYTKFSPFKRRQELADVGVFSQPAFKNGGPAVLPEMERLPVQHGFLLQTPTKREKFSGRDARLRGSDVQGA